jgi:hypothetical protein
VARCRGDQAVEQVGVLDCIAAAKRLDDAPDVTAALAGVLDEVEVFIRPDFLDTDEHGAEPDCGQDTMANRIESRLYAGIYRIVQAHLAPQFGGRFAEWRKYATFRPPEPKRWESWAWSDAQLSSGAVAEQQVRPFVTYRELSEVDVAS